MDLKGMGVALVTPFKEDESVDFETLQKLTAYQVQNGTDYLVVLGTTAETPTLAEEEKKEVIRQVVAQVRRRIPVVLGVGGNCTREVVKKLERDDFCGIDGILSVVPYYNKPSQEGIYQHYKALAQATPLPLILYNVPGRTGMNMTAQTALRIAREFERVVAVKEASGNIVQMNEIIKNKPQHFELISGDDGITFPLIALGAAGVISVIGNALPGEFGRMVHLALSGDYGEARAIHSRYIELFELLSVDGNPAGIKSMLHLMGFIANRLRLPLVPASISTNGKIRDVLQRLGYGKVPGAAGAL
jgi:4-hydroxy-tetrahydrodipicolinate synthase